MFDKAIGNSQKFEFACVALTYRFFSDCGFDVATVKGLKCKSPVLIAHESEQTLRDAIIEVNDDSIDAIVQVGTNLSTVDLFPVIEKWVRKPCLPINMVTAWHALRASGVRDKIDGMGWLLEHF